MSTAASRRRRPGRPPTDQSPLTVERILAVALKLVDEQGLERLSMRRLAQALDVDPMSIYHHLPNKAAVVSGLVEKVFAQMCLPAPEDGDWTDQIRAWVHSYHDLTRTHPHLVLQIVSDPAAVARAGELIDQPLQVALIRAGLLSDKVDACAGLLVDYVNGYALGEIVHLRAPTEQPVSPAGFDTGLDVILLGIRALAQTSAR